MNIKEISKYAEKPEIYTPGTAVMWTDEYISKQLLQVHLNTEVDLGSRKNSTIEKTTEWILDKTEKRKLNILDLGCGPGLYAELLAKKGHKVTGIDFSKNSIDYAQKQAVQKQLNIKYLHENYLNLNLPENQFDLVIIVYTDFGVLNPQERKQLLKIIRKSLKPRGFFIFDVLNNKNLEKKTTPKNWEAADKGFWRNQPYVALSESFLYPEEKVILYQHIVSDENNNTDVYRFYTHFFSESDLKNELHEIGFKNLSFHNNVLPEGDLWNGENVTFCVAVNSK